MASRALVINIFSIFISLSFDYFLFFQTKKKWFSIYNFISKKKKNKSKLGQNRLGRKNIYKKKKKATKFSDKKISGFWWINL